jgi:hypothetical protein
MTLFTLLLFTLGLLLETLILFRRAGHGPLPGSRRMHLGTGLAAGLLIAVAVLLTIPGGQDAFGFLEGGPEYTLEDGPAGLILVGPATLLFGLGVFYARILPPLRREGLLSILLLAWYVLPGSGEGAPDRLALTAAGIASLALALLLMQHHRLTGAVRFLLYLGGLSLLFGLAVEGFPYAMLDSPTIRPLEALLFAMAGVYLFFHCLFLLRLLLIALSLWRPCNRIPAKALLDKKFPDTGPPGRGALILLGLQAVFLAANFLLKGGIDGGILTFALIVFPQLLAADKRS